MIRTVLRLELAQGGADGLIQLFRERQILETSAAQDGCHGAEIAVASDGSHAIVTATWEDEQAYRRWTSRADRGDQGTEINPFLSTPLTPSTVGVTYNVEHQVTG